MEKEPGFERNGIKVSGGKNRLLYILAHGDTENLQHPGSFMMFIFIFLQRGDIFSIMKIFCVAFNTLSLLGRSGVFFPKFHFISISTLMSNFYKLTLILMTQVSFWTFFSHICRAVFN